LADRSTGFGSRLIEASLKGELSGTLTRDFSPDGLVIRIRFPLDPALNPARSR
jgi:two-component sensor histidine kinase